MQIQLMVRVHPNCLVDSSHYNVNITPTSDSHILFVYQFVPYMYLKCWSLCLKFEISFSKSWKQIVSPYKIWCHCKVHECNKYTPIEVWQSFLQLLSYYMKWAMLINCLTTTKIKSVFFEFERCIIKSIHKKTIGLWELVKNEEVYRIDVLVP